MFTQSKWKVFSENYKYRYISILGELLTFFEKRFFLAKLFKISEQSFFLVNFPTN